MIGRSRNIFAVTIMDGLVRHTKPLSNWECNLIDCQSTYLHGWEIRCGRERVLTAQLREKRDSGQIFVPAAQQMQTGFMPSIWQNRT